MPLNVGQERSIELINDVLRADRTLVMVAGRDPEVEAPGPDELYPVGVVGVRRTDDPPARRDAAGADPGRAAGADRALGRNRAVSGREVVEPAPDVVRESAELLALMRNVQQTFSSIVGRFPTCPKSYRSWSPTSTIRARSRI